MEISASLEVSNVTTSLPAPSLAWTSAPGSAAMAADMAGKRSPVPCTTKLET
jgi:hypothetical protein